MSKTHFERVKFALEIIRTICPVIMVLLQIAIITGMLIN